MPRCGVGLMLLGLGEKRVPTVIPVSDSTESPLRIVTGSRRASRFDAPFVRTMSGGLEIWPRCSGSKYCGGISLDAGFAEV
jgi:hypothetical protein